MRIIFRYLFIVGFIFQTLVNATDFIDIQNLIKSSKNGTIKNLTYICVGDSTRAESSYQGQYLYYELKDNLNSYNVKSKLFARAGHMADQFNKESKSPTWREVSNAISGDGTDVIVDICLGINDMWHNKSNELKTNIRSAINKIKNRKPNTKFILTMPNRLIKNNNDTEFLRSVYIELSNELELPLNNIIDDLMPTYEQTDLSWYRDDGVNVHLSRSGQHLVAEYILSNMLPFEEEELEAPNAPTSLEFTDITAHSVTLNWEDNSNNETGFKIYRNAELIYTTSKDITSYTDSGLKSNFSYKYTIKATN